MKIDLEFLSIQNPWWDAFWPDRPTASPMKFDPDLLRAGKAEMLQAEQVLGRLSFNKDIIYQLFGARGSGKSVALKLAIKKLIDNNIEPDNIFYYSCRNIDTYEQLNETIKIFIFWRRQETAKRLFIFIDEVSLVKNWQKGIDFLRRAGRFEKVTIILVGSFLPIEKNKKEAGYDFGEKIIMENLSFSEFVQLANPAFYKRLKAENYRKIKGQLGYYLDIYAITGGVAAAIDSYFKNGAVDQNVYNAYFAWLSVDAAKAGKDILLLRQIAERIIANLGLSVGYKTLSYRTRARTHTTVAEYLSFMEAMFASGQLYQSGAGTNKAKKIYFSDPFFFHFFYGWINGANDWWQFARERLSRDEIYHDLAEIMIFNLLSRSKKGMFYFFDSSRKMSIDFVEEEKKNNMPIILDLNNADKLESEKIFKHFGFKKGIIISSHELNLDGPIKLMPLDYFLAFWK